MTIVTYGVCPHCGREFEPNSDKQVYCGREDCNKGRRSERAKRCQARKRAGLPPVYKAKPDAPERICQGPGCSNILTQRMGAKYCCRNCKQRAHREAERSASPSSHRPPKGVCMDCGEPVAGASWRCWRCKARVAQEADARWKAKVAGRNPPGPRMRSGLTLDDVAEWT